MVQRISITVPDDLFEQLQQVKGRVNISRICQKALRETIDRESKQLDEGQNAIERWRKESESLGELQGREDAARKLGLVEMLAIYQAFGDQAPEHIKQMISEEAEASLPPVVRECLKKVTTLSTGSITVAATAAAAALAVGPMAAVAAPIVGSVVFRAGWVIGACKFFKSVRDKL